MKVREVIKLIEDDGWVLVRQTGSHRHYRHEIKPGTTTVAGNLGKEVKAGTVANILRQAGLKGSR
jgi:predicted RNA binding protein YcfA (HicA-like mRNA interferase family)